MQFESEKLFPGVTLGFFLKEKLGEVGVEYSGRIHQDIMNNESRYQGK